MPPIIHPALIIGLGGSGIEVARRFRRRFDAEYEQTPFLRLFCIDTAPQEQENAYTPLLPQNEFFQAAAFNPSDYVGPHTVDDRSVFKAWWRGFDGLPLQYVTAGAGQRRPVGRLAFFVHFPEIRRRLTQAIQEIFQSETYFNLPDKYKRTLNVYIVSSTCGGTGTGMFLDMATSIRRIVNDAQPGKQVRVRGLLMLPSLFLGTGRVPSSFSAALRANAFGALTELDYAMSLSVEQRPDCTYPGAVTVARQGSVFDTCYLVGNQTTSGAVVSDYGVLLERAAMHMMIELASPLGDVGDSRLDNVQSAIRENPEYYGRSRLYSSYAADWLELPGARVHVRWAKSFARHLLERWRGSVGQERVRTAHGQLQQTEGYGRLRLLLDRDGARTYLPNASSHEDAFREIGPAGEDPAVLVQRAQGLHDAYRRFLEAGSGTALTALEQALERAPDDVRAGAFRAAATGSLQDARQLLTKVMQDLDGWSRFAENARGGPSSSWLGDFTDQATKLTPGIVERFKKERPDLRAAQMDLVEQAMIQARDEVSEEVQARLARALLDQNRLNMLRLAVEELIVMVERLQDVAQPAWVEVDRRQEPIPSAVAMVGGLSDPEIDAAFTVEERVTAFEGTAASGIALLLDGFKAIPSPTGLADGVYRVAYDAVRNASEAFVGQIPLSPAVVADRLSRLEPFVLYTQEWGATDGASQVRRSAIVAGPEKLADHRETLAVAMAGDLELTSVGDPDRVLMTAQAHGFPLFAVAEIEQCRAAYSADDPARRMLRFTLPETEAREWDMRRPTTEDSERWFAVGLALGKVRRVQQRYELLDGTGTSLALGDGDEDPAAARKEARRKFGAAGYGIRIKRHVDTIAKRDGNDAVSAPLSLWLHSEETKAALPEYPAEFQSDVALVRAYRNSIL